MKNLVRMTDAPCSANAGAVICFIEYIVAPDLDDGTPDKIMETDCYITDHISRE